MCSFNPIQRLPETRTTCGSHPAPDLVEFHKSLWRCQGGICNQTYYSITNQQQQFWWSLRCHACYACVIYTQFQLALSPQRAQPFWMSPTVKRECKLCVRRCFFFNFCRECCFSSTFPCATNQRGAVGGNETGKHFRAPASFLMSEKC